MAVFLITYELHLPIAYDQFHNLLESFPNATAVDCSVLIESDTTATAIVERLHPHIGAHDSLFVCQIGRDWAGVQARCGNWLDEPERIHGINP